MCNTVLYYTPNRYHEFHIGSQHKHFGRWIHVTGRWMRKDLGDYFEIQYYYTS